MSKYVKKRVVLKFKHFIIIISAITVLFTIFITANHITTLKQENSSVATVNGEPITVKELMPKLMSHRAEVFEYFKNKHNVDPDKDFWESSYGGENPAEKLKKSALDECVKIKVQQILGKEKGLTDDISYSKYLKDLEEENKRRATAVKNKQVIYGPQQYTETTYYTILFTNLTAELKKKLYEQLVVSDEDVKKYYDDAIKNGEYKKAEKRRIEKIAIPFTAFDDKSKNAAKVKAEEIRAKYAAGESFKDLSGAYGKDTALNIEFGEQNFDASTRREDSRPAVHEFTEKAVSLNLGQVSDVFEFNNSFYVLKCIEKKDEGFYKIDEVNESIKQTLKERKYDEYIESLVKKANVVIDPEVYKKLKVE